MGFEAPRRIEILSLDLPRLLVNVFTIISSEIVYGIIGNRLWSRQNRRLSQR